MILLEEGLPATTPQDAHLAFMLHEADRWKVRGRRRLIPVPFPIIFQRKKGVKARKCCWIVGPKFRDERSRQEP